MDSFFKDYLDRLEELHKDIAIAIKPLSQEAIDWVPGDDIPSIGILVTHIAGAERYWIGDVAGGSPSERDRDAEFRTVGIDAGTLLTNLRELQNFERILLSKITLLDLDRVCISPRTGRKFTVSWALLHALEHTAIHLGHIQILCQMWEKQQDAGTTSNE